MLQLKKEFENIQKEINFFPEIEKKEKILTYLNCLLEFNRKMNLTSFKKLEDLLRLQVFDFYPLLDKKFSNAFVDIGAGAGFLTVPLSIFKENSRIISIEPNKRKCFFLNMVKFKLNLNFKLIEKRLEESLSELPKEKIDFLIKALPKKEKSISFLYKKFKFPHNLIYFAGKNYKNFIDDLKIWYSFKEMLKVPLRENSYILIFENVSRETWEEL